MQNLLGKIMLKCEYHPWSSGFWGMFICSCLSHHCICIALYVLKLQSFDYKRKHSHIILLRRIIGRDIYIVITDIYNLLYCYKDLIDLYYKLSEFHVTFDHINTSIWSMSHIFAQFEIPIKIRCLLLLQSYNPDVSNKIHNKEHFFCQRELT